MTFSQVAASLGAVLLFAAAGVSGVVAVKYRKIFKASRGKALLDGVTAEELANARIEWPLRESRWPRPHPDPTLDPMPAPEAMAYARLATRARQRASMSAQVLALFGGAWLGTSLPRLWELVTASDGIDVWSSNYAQLLGIVLCVQGALQVGTLVDDYAEVAAVYRRHALRTAGGGVSAGGPSPHRSRWQRMRDALRTYSRKSKKQRPEAGGPPGS
ncbi:hypothetical protein GCM10023339_40200 [Alloalcanivorax gelatiniphagus]